MDDIILVITITNSIISNTIMEDITVTRVMLINITGMNVTIPGIKIPIIIRATKQQDTAEIMAEVIRRGGITPLAAGAVAAVRFHVGR